MLTTIECQGEWWLPNTPDTKAHGQMTFHPSKGVSLELQGALEMTDGKSEIILGVSTESKEITLSNCVETGSKEAHGTSRMSGNTIISKTSHIHANMAFVGGHFANKRELLFHKASVSFTYLDEWANQPGLKVSHDKGRIISSFRPPEPLEAIIDKDHKISLVFGASESMSQTAYSIEQHASFLFESTDAEHFEKFRVSIECMQGLLTLLISEPVFPTQVEAHVQDPEPTDGKKAPPRSVRVYLPSSFAETVKDRVHWFHMPAPLSEMIPHFSRFINNWWNRYESLIHIQTLYYGTLCNPYLYLDNRFLSMVQAVESYHRLTMKNYVVEEAEYEAKMKSILDSVDKDYRNWLEYRMKYGNEPHLYMRLQDIFKNYFKGLEGLLDYGYCAIERIVSTRNYLTHYSPDLKEKRAQTSELYYLTQILTKALEIALLTELGYDLDDARKRAGKGGEFRYLQGYRAHLASMFEKESGS